jgi:hypothetical protein
VFHWELEISAPQSEDENARPLVSEDRRAAIQIRRQQRESPSQELEVKFCFAMESALVDGQ